MKKAELVQKLVERTPLTPSQAIHAVNGLSEILCEAFLAGESVTLRGFGQFKVSHRAQRVGRNLATGEPITLPATRVVRFKPSDALRQAFKEE
jgi:DNA-binding protein HU-beta